LISITDGNEFKPNGSRKLSDRRGIKKSPQQSGSFEVSPELLKKINEALALPIPGREIFGNIEGVSSPAKADKKILGIFKKKSLSPEELQDLRKTAIQSRKMILKGNMLGVQKLEGQSLYQSYETDPFFNIAFIAEMTVGLYQDDDHRKILDTAISAVNSLIKRDMSKNHVFTEPATNHSHKLQGLRDGNKEPKNQATA